MRKSIKRQSLLTLGRSSFVITPLFVFLISFFYSLFVLAGPTGEQVVSGNITVQRPSETYTEIQQTSDKGIINWQDFSIGAGEWTHFNQPSQTSITLNRVTGSQASSILGQLTAVGQIILLNRSGVLFGPSATVDVAGLIASTADMTNADFLSGTYRFNQGEGISGGIQQEGRITAKDGGYVILVAPYVSNTGFIQARLGKVALSSGTQYTVDLSGDQLIQFALTPSQLTLIRDEKGNPLPHGVFQSGNISASGGTVLMSTQAVNQTVAQLTNYEGVVEANTIENRAGQIILSGGTGTTVKVSGTLQAKGQKTGEKGGTIKVLGEKIEIGKTAPAKIDVSGPAGGGKILIGGNLQGKGPEPNAKETTVTTQTELLANATEQGPGGQIIVYSEGQTTMQGKAEAKGGPEGGAGGLIETSGKTLDVTGAQVKASAPKGESGMWLLDPATLTIGPTEAAAIIATLEGNTNVTAQAANLISVQSPISATTVTHPWLYLDSGNIEPGTGNIDIQQAIIGNFGLDITAKGGTITATAPIDVYNFRLNLGLWSQVGTGIGTLPLFRVANDFSIYSLDVYSFGSGIFKRLAGGTGSLGNPYLIEDIYGLQGLKNFSLLPFNYSLVQDLDASSTVNWNAGKGFEAIGAASSQFTVRSFVGTFFGNNRTITGLTINRPSGGFAGLFGYLEGTVQDLGLINSSIVGSGAVGGIVSVMSGENFPTLLSNVYTSGGTVSGTFSVGGLVGRATFGSISNSYNANNVVGIGSSSNIGGIVGYAEFLTILNNVYNMGSVSGINYVGGIAGFAYLDNFFNQVYNVGSVSGTNFVGGLVGDLEFSQLSKSYNMGTVSGTDSVGGLVGYAISYDPNPPTTIFAENVFNSGQVSGTSNVGGLIGYFDNSGGPTTLDKAHTVGKVIGTSTTGAVIGFGAAGPTVTNTYWDTQTAGVAVPVGGGGIGAGGITGYTSAQMAVQGNFPAFDFINTWFMGSFPYLRFGHSYDINNVSQLQLMLMDLAGNYQLMNDIDASVTSGWSGGLGFEPVGTATIPFTGTLSGNNHTITDLTINRPAIDEVALFGSTKSSTIQDFGLVSSDITGRADVGGIIGVMQGGQLTNVYNAGGSVTASGVIGSSDIGGLVGLVTHSGIVSNGGILTNVYNTSNVSGGINGSNVGGIAGIVTFSSQINNAYNTGTISGRDDIGGIVGYLSGQSITHVYNTGTVSGRSGIGGIIGALVGGTLNEAYNVGAVSGTLPPDIGSLIGFRIGVTGVDNTYWLTGTASIAVGGLGGSQNGTTQLSDLAMRNQASFGVNPPNATTGLSFFDPSSNPSGVWVMAGYPHLTMEHTYDITNPVQLQLMIVDLAGDYQLMNDINATETAMWNWNGSSFEGFQPIGNTSSPATSYFSGNLEGNQHTISNLMINRPTSNDIGLFGGVNSGSNTIQNFGLINSSILGQNVVGGIAGSIQNVGTLTNVYNTGTVSGTTNVGGLVGSLFNGTLSNAYNTGAISGTNAIGGIIGSMTSGTVSDVYNTGTISGTGSIVGGLVGEFLGGSLTRSYNTGTVSGDNTVGGIAGYGNVGSISQSYNIGSVSAVSSNVGGLVGATNSFNLTDNYNVGSVSGGNGVGGAVGYLGSGSTFTNIYNAGSVTSGGVLGGLIGVNAGTMTTSYWNTDNAGALAVGGGSSTGATGLTTSQMKQESSFAGFNFNTIWNIGEGVTYPFFRWRFVPLSGFSNVPSMQVQALLNGSVTPYVPTNAFGSVAGLSPEGFTDSVATGPVSAPYSYWILFDKTATAPLAPGLSPVLAYLTPSLGNLVTVYNPNGMSGNIYNNTVDVVGALAPTTEMSATFLQQAGTSLVTPQILYNVSGGNLGLTSGASLLVDTPYHLTGNISASGGGNITFTANAPVTMGTNSILTGSNIALGSSVSGPTYNLNLNGVNTIALGGSVTGPAPVNVQNLTANITSAGGGTTTLYGGPITTTQDQIYQNAGFGLGAINLAADTTLSGRNITFSQALTGNQALNLTVLETALFNKSATIGSLTIAASGDTELAGGSVTTTGAQFYGNPVILSSDNVLTGSGITFNQTIDGNYDLTLDLTSLSGIIQLNQPIDIGSLTTGALGTTHLDAGTVTTTGAQVYGNPVILSTSNLLTGSDITFDGAITGNQALNLDLTSPTGTIQLNQPISIGSLTAGLLGTTNLDAGIVTTTGAQVYGNPVVLGTNTVLTGSSMTFNDTLNGPYSLILDTAGNIDWKGIVGGIQPLSTVYIVNAHNVINEQQLYANQFIQEKGTGTTYLSGTDFGIHYAGNPNPTQFVQLGTGTAIIINQALTGNIFANNLLFWTPTIADLGGSIAGLGPEPSALRVAQSLLGPIGPGTHFFENIDLFFGRTNFYLTLLPYFPTYYSREIGGIRFDMGSYFNEPYSLFGSGIVMTRDQLESYQPSMIVKETKKIVYRKGSWWIWIGEFDSKAQAERRMQQINRLGGFAAHIEEEEKGKWIVLVDPYPTKAKAEAALRKLETLIPF